MTLHYDYLIIGAGSAGYAAARTALQYTSRVALVDNAPRLGGLCILHGCMPSKTLLHTTDLLHQAQHAHQLGLHIPQARLDLPALQRRKRALIEDFAQYRQNQLQTPPLTLHRAHAHFKDAHTLLLDDQTPLQAPRILIATGSIPHWPDLPGLDPKLTLTSDDILSLETLPETLTILGGGTIACELAQYLVRAGTHVTLLQRSPRLLTRQASAQAAEALEQSLRKTPALTVLTDTRIERIEHLSPHAHRITYTHEGRTHTHTTQALLNALGRRPNTASLQLHNAHLTPSPTGHIPCNLYQQSLHVPHLYAAGDCAGPHEIVHTAILQAECATHHAFGKPAQPLNPNHLTTVTFTDPQIARTGPQEQELRAQGHALATATYPFHDHGKALVMNATEGYVSVTADRQTHRILAAECVGQQASELIHTLAVAVALQATPRQLLQAHWYHPTLSEIWTYPLESLAEELGV